MKPQPLKTWYLISLIALVQTLGLQRAPAPLDHPLTSAQIAAAGGVVDGFGATVTYPGFIYFNAGNSNSLFLTPFSIGMQQAAAEPVPDFQFNTFSGGIVNFTEQDVTNWIQNFKTNGVIAAANSVGGPGFSIYLYNWAATNRDANGNLTWDTNRFPTGVPYLINYCHSNSVKLTIFLNTDNIAYGFGQTTSFEREFGDATNVLSWGADGLAAEGDGSKQGATNAYWADFHPNSREWTLNTNYNFCREQMLKFVRAIQTVHYPITPRVGLNNDWTNSWASHVVNFRPIKFQYGVYLPWDFVLAFQNEYYLPQYGSQRSYDGDYANLTNSIAAQSNLVSLVDAVTNAYVASGNYPRVGTLVVNNGGSQTQYLTNFLTAAAMLNFRYDTTIINAGTAYTATLLANPWAVFRDPLQDRPLCITNLTSGESILQVWKKRTANGYAIWYWNQSTNTATTVAINLAAALGIAGDYAFADAWQPTVTTNSVSGTLTLSVPALGMRLLTINMVSSYLSLGQTYYYATNITTFVGATNTTLTNTTLAVTVPPGVYDIDVGVSAYTESVTSGLAASLKSKAGDSGNGWEYDAPTRGGLGSATVRGQDVLISGAGDLINYAVAAPGTDLSTAFHGLIVTTTTNTYTLQLKQQTTVDVANPVKLYFAHMSFTKH